MAVQLTFDFDFSDVRDTARENRAISRHEPVLPQPEKNTADNTPHIDFPRKTGYRSFGSWISFTRRLTASERITINNEISHLLEKTN
jgi:hypothetical protein